MKLRLSKQFFISQFSARSIWTWVTLLVFALFLPACRGGFKERAESGSGLLPGRTAFAVAIAIHEMG